MSREMWPLNSRELNPLDYHVWGYVRGLKYIAEVNEMPQMTV